MKPLHIDMTYFDWALQDTPIDNQLSWIYQTYLMIYYIHLKTINTYTI